MDDFGKNLWEKNEITDLDDALQKIRDKDDFWLNIH